jgi:hypothetical protein
MNCCYPYRIRGLAGDLWQWGHELRRAGMGILASDKCGCRREIERPDQADWPSVFGASSGEETVRGGVPSAHSDSFVGDVTASLRLNKDSSEGTNSSRLPQGHAETRPAYSSEDPKKKC